MLLPQAKKIEWGLAMEAALAQTNACFKTPILITVWAGLSEYSNRNRKLVELNQNRPATHVLKDSKEYKP